MEQKTELKQIKNQLVINARRWFDKVNGNTYHAVQVFDGNELIAKKGGLNYGYGEHYRQTAFEELIKVGYYSAEKRENGTYISYSKFQDDLRKALVFCNDMSRQKDLKEWD